MFNRKHLSFQESTCSRATESIIPADGGSKHTPSCQSNRVQPGFMNCGSLWLCGSLGTSMGDVPPAPSGPSGEFSPLFPWIPSLQTGAKSWRTWFPFKMLTRGRQRLWPSVTLFEDDRVELGPLPGFPLLPHAFPAICLHLALHHHNKDPLRQPA